ncbi:MULTISPECIES: hypothetical protein [Mycobacteriaceae]|uniref:Uncharacterized protein n=1 Tax=Mycolicibacterium neoaurum VKM Ac-1815D TaxID=700508 RepID=V5X8S0_MYCNE|nr:MULTISPECIES: hypothetical protein [Mycobacteriaceae]AHC24855.1 hypothetical protein D174_09825 [Mycolicibacterium neoaurum VKM Ac-1815D]AMO05401.1 hypothetical protein MyAD_09630 [Mycolicibacterium neoaurum]AXK76282.1 hypothetical protein DXK33_15415 [Mycolicibacterium neoaurum]KJQ50755.1 hypothetical protein TS71_09140 [Mycolicibacterium neoaurum]KUM09944.1 hypothetical protein AVZ31_03660 [Mycolicibacterium neoaurum]
MSVTPTDLTGTERAVLLVLMAQARPVPNADLLAYGPKLDKRSRDKLNTLDLIESERVGGRYVHELTDRGWRLCRDIIAAGAPPRSTGPAKTLYTVLAGLGRYLDTADLSLAELFWPKQAPSAADRITQAYTELAERPGAWVGLRTLRQQLDDVADLDDTLTQLYRTGAISLIPEENQKVLTDEDRAAAITIGGQAKHLIAIEV